MGNRRNALTVAKAVEMVNIAEGYGAMSGVRKRARTAGTKSTFGGAHRGEQKYVDIAVAKTNVHSDAPLFILCNGVTQNTSINGRIANRIWVKTLSLNFSAIAQSAIGGDDELILRCLVVVDKQANGAILTLGDLLNNGGTPTERWKAFKRIEFTRRFRIVKDTLLNLNPTNGGGDFNRQLLKKVHLTFKRPVVTEYTATGNGITAIESNSMYVIFITNQDAVSTNGIEVYPNIRITYEG